jgi:hypothetical protein
MYNIYGRAFLARPHLTIPQPERVAMMSHRIPSAALLLCTLAACGQSPTGSSDVHAQPGGPSYDGGFTMGSGNNAVQAGGGFTIGSGNVEETGGFGIGSGYTAGGLGIGTVSSGGEGEDPPLAATQEEGGFGIGSGN